MPYGRLTAKILGAVALLPAGWRVIKSSLDYAGYSDLILAHSEKPGWVGTMFTYIADPPSWLIAPTLLVGFCLIWWQSRKSPVLSPATEDIPRRDPPRSLIQKEPSELTNEHLKFRTSLHTSALSNLASKLQVSLFEGKIELKRAVEKLNQTINPDERKKLESRISSMRTENTVEIRHILW